MGVYDNIASFDLVSTKQYTFEFGWYIDNDNNNPKVRQTTAGRNSSDYYIEGAQNLKLKETKNSKKRTGTTPRSYNITGAKRW